MKTFLKSILIPSAQRIYSKRLEIPFQPKKSAKNCEEIEKGKSFLEKNGKLIIVNKYFRISSWKHALVGKIESFAK